MGETVETASGAEAAVDRRSGQSSLLHRSPVPLQVSSGGCEHQQAMISGPLEQVAKIGAVGVEGPAA